MKWWQNYIREGMEANGFWNLDIAKSGKYEFSLRRWPIEVDKPINAAIEDGTVIRATKARLKIAQVDVTKPISKDDCAATFQVELNAGKASLETWFMNDTSRSRGAYYVYIKRLI